MGGKREKGKGKREKRQNYGVFLEYPWMKNFINLSIPVCTYTFILSPHDHNWNLYAIEGSDKSLDRGGGPFPY